jgi:alpha-L-fucosidase
MTSSRTSFVLLITIFLLISLPLRSQTDSGANVLPNPKQVAWIDKEVGVIIHLDINIYAPETFDYAKKSTLPPASAFNPSRLDTDQWIESAKKAGATYAVLTAKHGTGFCLWKTKVHDYHTGNSPYGGDVVSQFIKSCKKYGLKPGIYYNTNMNTYYEAGYVPMSDEKRIAFNKAVFRQLEELWSEYGELYEIWFDGGVMSDSKLGIATQVKALIKKYQPEAFLFNGLAGASPNIVRWVENEDGRTPYPFWSRINPVILPNGEDSIVNGSGDPNGKYWVGAEADFPNRNTSAWNGGWLWKSGEDDKLFDVHELLDRYYTSVGGNTNMLIGMAIDTSGQFPAADKKIFEDFGNMIKAREKTKQGSAKGSGAQHTISYRTPKEINQVEIQEDISKGERIRRYKVEGLVDGKWTLLCDGMSVGHKRIQLFNKIKVSTIRLTITDSSHIPVIRNFTAFNYSPTSIK